MRQFHGKYEVKGQIYPIAAPNSATPIKGAGVNKTGFEEAIVIYETGKDQGSPTGGSVVFKLQHSDDDVDGNYTDVGAAYNKTWQHIDDDQIYSVRVDLKELKKFIRVIVTVTLTGGTSPTKEVAACIILGEKTYNY